MSAVADIIAAGLGDRAFATSDGSFRAKGGVSGAIGGNDLPFAFALVFVELRAVVGVNARKVVV